MTDTERMLAKQFLLRVRQEGYSIVENSPLSVAPGMNIDIYRGKTKICTFDDHNLGEGWYLRVRTDDSTREEIKADYSKLFYTFINLRDLYMIYEAAEPLRGYDQSLGYRAIMQYNNCVLAVRGQSRLGELEFGTFIIGKKSRGYGDSNTILHNTYFNMDAYPLARLDFVIRSGLLPKEQLITSDNIKYLHESCDTIMRRDGTSFREDAKAELGQVIKDLEKAEDSFREVDYRTTAISAFIPQYIDTTILTVKGIFTKHQIDRATLLKGLFAYDIQFSSDELKPEKLWPSVIGRRFGTVITAKPLPIGENGYTELKENDFSLNPEKRLTMRGFRPINRDAR